MALVGYAIRGIQKCARLNTEACGERLDLPHVETAAPGWHFGDDALATNLGQVLLSQTMLFH